MNYIEDFIEMFESYGMHDPRANQPLLMLFPEEYWHNVLYGKNSEYKPVHNNIDYIGELVHDKYVLSSFYPMIYKKHNPDERYYLVGIEHYKHNNTDRWVVGTSLDVQYWIDTTKNWIDVNQIKLLFYFLRQVPNFNDTIYASFNDCVRRYFGPRGDEIRKDKGVSQAVRTMLQKEFPITTLKKYCWDTEKPEKGYYFSKTYKYTEKELEDTYGVTLGGGYI